MNEKNHQSTSLLSPDEKNEAMTTMTSSPTAAAETNTAAAGIIILENESDWSFYCKVPQDTPSAVRDGVEGGGGSPTMATIAENGVAEGIAGAVPETKKETTTTRQTSPTVVVPISRKKQPPPYSLKRGVAAVAVPIPPPPPPSCPAPFQPQLIPMMPNGGASTALSLSSTVASLSSTSLSSSSLVSASTSSSSLISSSSSSSSLVSANLSNPQDLNLLGYESSPSLSISRVDSGNLNTTLPGVATTAIPCLESSSRILPATAARGVIVSSSSIPRLSTTQRDNQSRGATGTAIAMAISREVVWTDTILQQHSRRASCGKDETQKTGATTGTRHTNKFVRKRRTGREGYYFYNEHDKSSSSSSCSRSINNNCNDTDTNDDYNGYQSWWIKVLFLLFLIVGSGRIITSMRTMPSSSLSSEEDRATTTIAPVLMDQEATKETSSASLVSTIISSLSQLLVDQNDHTNAGIRIQHQQQEEKVSDQRRRRMGQLAITSITSSASSFSRSSSSGGSRGDSSTKHDDDDEDTSTDNPNDPMLVIAGKINVDDANCNIGQFNLRTQKWSLSKRVELTSYDSYSGGAVLSILANHTQKMWTWSESSPTPTNPPMTMKGKTTSTSKGHPHEEEEEIVQPIQGEGSGELIVVGAFDTTKRNSQVSYCSVGKWDGNELSKVGEGLCNSALSKGMKVTTAAMAGTQDVYVAGSFETQVWNGEKHKFVKIYNIAHFSVAGKEGPVWLPLNIGQITCSWCTVTVLALAWDSKRKQLHVAGKFNSIDGHNIEAGLAIYDFNYGRLVAHPGGGLSMKNRTQDGVATALQLDEEKGVLYVMGSFERLTTTSEICYGLAAYDIGAHRWTCLASKVHTVQVTGNGNMLLTPYGLMVAGKAGGLQSTWKNASRPYTIAVLHTSTKTHEVRYDIEFDDDDYFDSHSSFSSSVNKNATSSSLHRGHNSSRNSNSGSGSGSGTNSSTTQKKQHHHGDVVDQQSMAIKNVSYHEYRWSWLPGFEGNDEPIHALANGFGAFEGAVFIAGDNSVTKWSYELRTVTRKVSSSAPTSNHSRTLYRGSPSLSASSSSHSSITESHIEWIGVTKDLSEGHIRGQIMAISQMRLTPTPTPKSEHDGDYDEDAKDRKIDDTGNINVTIMVTLVTGCVIGILGAVIFNRKWSKKFFPCFLLDNPENEGVPLDVLALRIGHHTKINETYQRAMKSRYVEQPHLLTIIDPQEIFLQRIIGEGNFGRVWSARWNSASVAVKEFVFAQAALMGRSAMQQEIVEEIIGEAGMMAILRHPNVLQLFGCSLTAQAIWIVSELCSLGSLRQVLDDQDRSLPKGLRVNLALQIAEGMSYLHNQEPAIIHRDLKSHNIFVHETFIDTKQDGDANIHGPTGDGQVNQLTRWLRPQGMKTRSTLVVKIGDWGSARATMSGTKTMTHGVGTACWLAPEVIKHARSSMKSDVYGYGIILWEMATRKEVYEGLESTQIIANVANEGLRPPIPDKDCPWKDIMVGCWTEIPQDRPDFNEVVEQLNNINRNLSDEDYEKERECIPLETIEESSTAEAEEETPLIIDESDTTSSSSSEHVIAHNRTGHQFPAFFSNILRQRRGE